MPPRNYSLTQSLSPSNSTRSWKNDVTCWHQDRFTRYSSRFIDDECNLCVWVDDFSTQTRSHLWPLVLSILFACFSWKLHNVSLAYTPCMLRPKILPYTPPQKKQCWIDNVLYVSPRQISCIEHVVWKWCEMISWSTVEVLLLHIA